MHVRYVRTASFLSVSALSSQLYQLSVSTEPSERMKLRKKENERKVSSFRFTVVVGEIWPCSYSTLRTEPEEE